MSLQAQDIPPYDRGEWKHWIDEDKDGQDTREEAIERDAVFIISDYGLWIGFYSGEIFTNPSKMDADHIVPLEHAHFAGGWKWTAEEKEDFANDLENILMVSASQNRSKGSRGPAIWMPDNFNYWCEYVDKWTALKKKYKLIINNDERKVIKLINRSCD